MILNPTTIWLPAALRLVLRKLFGRWGQRRVPYFELGVDATGLRIRASDAEIAVEYFQPGTHPPFRTAIPLVLLAELSGSRDQPLELSHPRAGVLLAKWQERGIPRSQEYELPAELEPVVVPQLPETWSENPSSFVAALREAFATTDDASTRYALQCVQLRGASGEIGATDGRQGLLQAGFRFPFQEDVLVKGTKVFECSALETGSPVQVGLAEDRFVLRTGPWTFWLPTEKESRFPRLNDSIPAVSEATTSLELGASDLRFLRANLARLPGTADDRKVTLDLNGSVALRVAPAGAAVPTELVLTRSNKSGDDLRLCFDRRFLARVAAMELSQLHLYGAAGVIRASDERRSYVWMPYAAEGVVPPHEQALRVESPAASTSRSSTPVRSEIPLKRKSSPPEKVADVKPTSRTQPSPAERPLATTSIDVAIALQEQVRHTLRSLKYLIRQLKAERAQQRLLKSTLASLKQLQPVD